MARNAKYKLIYDSFKSYIDLCIREDRSILWPTDQIWTLDHVQELKRRLVNSPIMETGRSFENKLLEQMHGAEPVLWRMLADVYYLYFLPSRYITLEKKQNDIAWAAEQGGFVSPSKNAEIWKAQDAGYTRTSMRYHTKYAQFWLIILFALKLKQSDDLERVLVEQEKMQSLLDEILVGIEAKTDRAYDMRHAILYMGFPDYYERIISTRDKERILETYRSEVDEISPDLDKSIFEIRSVLPERRKNLTDKFDFYEDLIDEWRPKKRPISVIEEDVIEVTKGIAEPRIPYDFGTDKVLDDIIAALSHSKNIILYGPPGTGKTYFAKKAAEVLASPRKREGVSEAVLRQQVAERLTFHDLLALGMYKQDPDGRYSVPILELLPIIEARFIVAPVKHTKNQIWGYLQAHTSPESATVKISRRAEPFLFDKDEESKWYLTEEGQHYVRNALSEDLESLSDPGDATEASFVGWVTFHQSYSYEEFVEGLRPLTSEDDPGEVIYDVVPGAFKRISARAMVDPKNNYVLVIDEINRGNIAKIFGELITLLEDDKRIGEPNELSIALAYTPNRRFSVPNNLYIIGTMNTADRSIALLDVALRRRFSFVEIMPSPELLDDVVVESTEAAVDLGKLLRSLNRKIVVALDRDHQVGHSYFMKLLNEDLDDRVGLLEYIWNHQVFPLLHEYFYSQPEELFEILAPMYTQAGITKQDIMLGEAKYEFERLTGDDLLFALSQLAKDIS